MRREETHQHTIWIGLTYMSLIDPSESCRRGQSKQLEKRETKERRRDEMKRDWNESNEESSYTTYRKKIKK